PSHGGGCRLRDVAGWCRWWRRLPGCDADPEPYVGRGEVALPLVQQPLHLHTGATVARRSPCVFLALLLALPGAVGPAHAADGLFLSWNQCAPAGSQDRTFDCQTSLGQSNLFGAFTVAQPVDSVLGIEAVIDLQAAGLGVPDWWGVY